MLSEFAISRSPFETAAAPELSPTFPFFHFLSFAPHFRRASFLSAASSVSRETRILFWTTNGDKRFIVEFTILLGEKLFVGHPVNLRSGRLRFIGLYCVPGDLFHFPGDTQRCVYVYN